MPTTPAQLAVVDGLWKLVRGWVADSPEGPGALVARATWDGAVRQLADSLLGDAGLPVLSGLTLLQGDTVRLLDAMTPAPAREWDGHLAVVIGCGRSGTTWLERMLMSSAETGGVDGVETFLFEQAAPLWAQLPAMAPLVDRDGLVRALRAFFDTVFSAALERHHPGARVFVEKTPLHSLRLGELNAVYPDASYVHVVRDGRDVARSISQVDFFQLPDPADAARLWRHVLTAVRAASGEIGRFREVRYEALNANPIEEVSALLTWLGVEMDDAVRDELEARAGTRVSSHAGTAQPVGAGTWQSLPGRELARVYAECGDVLVREGYATARDLRRARSRPSYWSRTLVRAR